eukprot:1820575-Alexandrium_andersonii.AAC.1
MQPPPPPVPPGGFASPPPPTAPPPPVEVPPHPDAGRDAHFEVWRTEPRTHILVSAPMIGLMRE